MPGLMSPRRLRGASFLGALVLAACGASPEPASPPAILSPADGAAMPVVTLDDLQGCWWTRCGLPHADFCIQGDRVGGDLEEEGAAAVAGNRLMVVFPDGTSFNDRILHASRDRLVLDGGTGRVTYLACR
jgi:hypothetical protein